MIRFLALVLFCAGCLTAAPVSAQPTGDAPMSETAKASDHQAARLASKIADQLKSPFCPGKTLLTCTSGKAFEVRKEIKRYLDEGKSQEEVIELLQARYGDEIRNPPQPWLTGLVPILPFILGALVLVIAIVVWRKRGGLASSDAPPPDLPDDPETMARLARLRKQVDGHDDL